MNPVYVNCEHTNSTDDYERPTGRHLAKHVEKMSRLVDADDVRVKRTGHGVYFTPRHRLKVNTYKKLSYCWETVRRESMPRIAEMDVEMTT